MTTADIISLILAAGGLGGGGVSLYRALNDRKEGVESHEIQEQSVSTKALVDTVETLQGLNKTLHGTLTSTQNDVKELTSRMDSLEEKLDATEASNRDLVARNEIYRAHIETLNDHIERQLPPPPPSINWPSYLGHA